jgi:chromosome segregation ATPase
MPSKSTSSKTDQPHPSEPSLSAEPLGGELERLRDILIGSHARTVSERLDHLEARSGELAAELTKLSAQIAKLSAELKTEIKNASKESDSQLHATRQEILTILTSEVAALRKEGQEQVKRSQAEGQATNDRLQKLAADTAADLRAAQTDLKSQIESQTRDLTTRMNQKDDALSQELRQLAAQLEGKKVARDELAQLLQDIAQRLVKSKS